ncbi:MAG: large repetitive protein, partial [Actinomycetota bacterium]|nr:large repetitive protein [Actinomycetota bacterium]
SQTYTLAADGTYTFSVVATGDGVDSAATTRTYTLDTTAPPAPAITAAPAAVSNDDTPTWTYTVGTGTAVTRCSVTSGGSTIFAAAPCTSPKTFDLTTQPDGTYTFTVTAFDGVGNASPSASDTYVLQRITPPAAPVITASPASPDNDNTPTWSFTLPAGTTGECLLLQGSTVVSGPVACSASQTFTIAADGNYLFRVSAIDTITNARSLPTTSTTYTLDRVAPAASTFSGTPATPGKVLTPKWTFTTPAGAATLECTLKRGTTVISAPAPCAGTFQPNLAGKPDGTYTLTVVAIDAAGNRSPGLTGTYTLDTVPPAAPRITNGPSGLTTTSSPAWTFTTDPATTSTCKLEQGRTVISAAKPCSGSTSYDLTGRVDGTYTFTVVSTDTAGNVGPSTVVNITVDRTAPGKPTITSGPASTSNDTTPTWTFTPAAGTTLLRCTVSQGATVVVAPTPCTSPATFDLNAFPDGTYTFGVVAYDAAANASPAATSIYTLRTTRVLPPPPPPPTPTPTPTPNPRPTPSPAAVTVTPTPVPAAVSTLPPPSLGPGEPGRPNRIVAAPKPVRPAIKLPDGEPGLTTPTTEAPLPPPAGIVEAAGRVVTEASRGAAFPLLLVALVILFLAIQDQIDRRDPKLSDAPVHAGEELEFGPPPSRRGT